jgi:deoxyribose-phosphate aldolase
MSTLSLNDVAGRVELTLFAADATRAQIEALCAEALEKSYAAVSVNGTRVELARTFLDETDVLVSALIDFPLGAADTDIRRYATETAVDQGAQEIELVLSVGRLKDRESSYILRELRDIVEAADERPVKLVLESHLLTRDEKILACHLAVEAGLKFVSTATDFHSALASVTDVELLRHATSEGFGIKASGRIRDAQLALELLKAGATRLGIVHGTKLVGLPE